ncbi:YidC/Oxa1 family membrane protein insertase [Streptomyces sp. NRRL S-337]|uniref:YidC/Oxa1 family membrane protein insertase n=1 Tax=Streptomyces sp. NRRL S-337 TaxID=1463900 RepID=UPI0004C88DF6|nr:membrane protein insertase YidC [Streptomyces sp. NRRL S-337]
MSMFGFLGDALGRGAAALDPLFGGAAVAATIVLFTLAVRAALHPLARAAARGETARAALAPQLAALQRKHKNDPERLQKAMADLYAKTGASPLSGCLPSLLQLPVFFVMYHLFSTGGGGLLDHTLLGAPLGGHWSEALADGGPFGPQGLVYLALFVLIAAVATWNYRRARATAAQAPTQAPTLTPGRSVPGMASLTKLMPLLSFGTLITVAVVPLAAGLYMVTTTTWTACERALLKRDKGEKGAEGAEGPEGKKESEGKKGPEGKKESEGSKGPKGDEQQKQEKRQKRQGAVPAAAEGNGAAAKKPAVTPAAGTPSAATATSPGRAPQQHGPQQRAPKSRAARQRVARARANAEARTRTDAQTRRPLPADVQARARRDSGGDSGGDSGNDSSGAGRIVTTAQ